MKHHDWDYLREYWKYLRKYWSVLIWGFVLIPAISIFHLVQPLLLRHGIDQNILKKDIPGLYTTVFVFGLCVLLELVCRSAQSYIFQKVGIQSVTDIRRDLFRHLLTLSSTYFDKTPVGILVSRITSDIESLNESFSSGAVTLLTDLLTLFLIFVAMFVLSPKLTLVTLVFLPFLMLIVNYFRKKLRVLFNKIRSVAGALNGYLQEQLNGVQIVQLLRREKRNFQIFGRLSREYNQAALHSVYYDALLYSVVEATSSVVIGVILWKGYKAYLGETITLGVLVAFIEYIQKFFNPLKELSSKFAVLQQALAALEKIFQSFALKDRIPSGTRTISAPKGHLIFRNVSFAYPGFESKPVLKNISFEIKPGEVVAIVGPTGSGKTSISRLISHLYTGYRGDIELDGVEIRDLTLASLRSNISVVLQEVALFSGTIAFNITLGEEGIPLNAVKKVAEWVQLDNFIQTLPEKYATLLKGRNGCLSAGQAQLLSFARAILKKTPILVLDEATASVDSLNEKLIQKAIENIFKEKTVLVIAHRLSTIQKANKIIALRDGEIVETGTHEELMNANGFYAKLFRMQFTHL